MSCEGEEGLADSGGGGLVDGAGGCDEGKVGRDELGGECGGRVDCVGCMRHMNEGCGDGDGA